MGVIRDVLIGAAGSVVSAAIVLAIGSANDWFQRAIEPSPKDIAKAFKDDPDLLQVVANLVVVRDGKDGRDAEFPEGAILALHSASCPSPWVPYEAAFGRFLRGIDLANSGIDPDGKRTPGSLQASEVGPHEHPYKDWSGAHNGGLHGGWTGENDGVMADRGSQPNAGKETRPVNVAVIFCRKAD